MFLFSEGFSCFDFDDVMLVPGKCVVRSRSEVSVSCELGGREFKLPVIPANMSSIIDEKLALWLARHNYFYVMHRFDVDNKSFVRLMRDRGLFSSISVGVQDSDYVLVRELASEGLVPDYVTIDIAHGHADSVMSMIMHIKEFLPECFVIAGNVATPEGVLDLEAAGADAVKVGVGPGKACSSSPNTGFGTRGWHLSAVRECALVARRAVIIADGGVRNNGDIAKAITMGASMVMIGGLFAGHDENPGQIRFENGKKYKAYYGSASAEQKKNNHNVEGVSMLVDYKGSIQDTLSAMNDNLRSAVSYAGGRKLEDLLSVKWVCLK